MAEFGGFFSKVVRFERKKIILPVLMLVVLISAVGLGSHLRSAKVDREFMRNRQQSAENLMIIFTEHKFFNQSIDATQRERSQAMVERMQQEQKQIMNQPAVKSEAYLLLFVYDSGLYPLLPSSIPGEQSSSILFSESDGYFMTDTFPETLAEVLYFQYRIEELNKEINESRENWTLEKFRREAGEIRSIEYPDERIINQLERSNFSSLGMGRALGMHNTEGGWQAVTENRVKEVKFYHFIPSAISTFLLYYLISGLVIESFRLSRSRLGKSS